MSELGPYERMNNAEKRHVIQGIQRGVSDEVTALRAQLTAAEAEAQQLRRQLLDAELETRHWAGRNGDLVAENARLRQR